MRSKPVIFIGSLLLLAAAGGFFYWNYQLEHRFDRSIIKAASHYGLEPGLVKAVVWRESRFNSQARGAAGEIGLMQVGEEAAREWADAEKIRNFSHEHCIDPRTNLYVGSYYLKKALEKYRKADDPLPYALAEYNAGRGNVLRWRSGAGTTNGESFIQQIGFSSTSNYVRDVIANEPRFTEQFKALSVSNY